MSQKPDDQPETGNGGKIIMRDAKGRILPGSGGLKKPGTPQTANRILKTALGRIGEAIAYVEEGQEVTYDDAILLKLAQLAQGGDMQAIVTWMAYRFGRPTAMKDGEAEMDRFIAYMKKMMGEKGLSGWEPGSNATDVNGHDDKVVNGKSEPTDLIGGNRPGKDA